MHTNYIEEGPYLKEQDSWRGNEQGIADKDAVMMGTKRRIIKR